MIEVAAPRAERPRHRRRDQEPGRRGDAEKQREYYLREQLKAIRASWAKAETRKRRSHGSANGSRRLRVPDYVMKAAEEQLERLSNIPRRAPNTASSSAIWTMHEFRGRSRRRITASTGAEDPDEDHYDLAEVKDRILEYLAVRKLKADMKGPILCFVGLPGVGKTSLGRSIARAMGREFVRMSLGGMRDEAEIRGHRRTYIGAMPGRIVQSLKLAGTNNPVFMLDEIDKIGADFEEIRRASSGGPGSRAERFVPGSLPGSAGSLNVLFIATANVLDTIQPALQDRMEIIRLPGYTDREKLHIARQYLVPKQLEENGLTEAARDRRRSAGEDIVTETREAGVRNWNARSARSAARWRPTSAAERSRRRRQPEDVSAATSDRAAFPQVASRSLSPAWPRASWTSSGGEILFVEATRMPGKRGSR